MEHLSEPLLNSIRKMPNGKEKDEIIDRLIKMSRNRNKFKLWIKKNDR